MPRPIRGITILPQSFLLRTYEAIRTIRNREDAEHNIVPLPREEVANPDMTTKNVVAKESCFRSV